MGFHTILWSKLNIKIQQHISLVLHVVYYTLLSLHRSGGLLHVTQSPREWWSTTRYSVSTGSGIYYTYSVSTEVVSPHVTQSPQERYLVHVTQSPQGISITCYSASTGVIPSTQNSVLHRGVVYYTLLGLHRSGVHYTLLSTPQEWRLLHVTQSSTLWHLLHVTQLLAARKDAFTCHQQQEPFQLSPIGSPCGS